MEEVIKIPSRLTLVSEVLGLRLSRKNCSEDKKYVVDFSACTFGEPTPLLLLAREINKMILRNPEAKFACRSRPGEFRGYADHIGFFQHAGFVRGNPPGAAMGSSTYLPITTIDANELKTSSGERPYGELAEEKALHMARVLTQTDTGASFHTIAYAIREMLRNSIEHSFSDEVVMLAQFWPFKNQAEIAIYDGGIGVRNSLSDTEETDAISDEDAITLALKPGVRRFRSGKGSSAQGL